MHEGKAITSVKNGVSKTDIDTASPRGRYYSKDKHSLWKQWITQSFPSNYGALNFIGLVSNPVLRKVYFWPLGFWPLGVSRHMIVSQCFSGSRDVIDDIRNALWTELFFAVAANFFLSFVGVVERFGVTYMTCVKTTLLYIINFRIL